MLDIKREELRRTSEPPKRSITTEIVIHHTERVIEKTAEELNNAHINDGWIMIGYNFVVHKDGTVEQGRPMDAVGMHCIGSNSTSIGVALCGDFSTESFTDAQRKALIELLVYLCTMYNLKAKAVLCHSDKSRTKCPGVNVINEIESIRAEVHEVIK